MLYRIIFPFFKEIEPFLVLEVKSCIKNSFASSTESSVILSASVFVTKSVCVPLKDSKEFFTRSKSFYLFLSLVYIGIKASFASSKVFTVDGFTLISSNVKYAPSISIGFKNGEVIDNSSTLSRTTCVN